MILKKVINSIILIFMLFTGACTRDKAPALRDKKSVPAPAPPLDSAETDSPLQPADVSPVVADSSPPPADDGDTSLVIKTPLKRDDSSRVVVTEVFTPAPTPSNQGKEGETSAPADSPPADSASSADSVSGDITNPIASTGNPTAASIVGPTEDLREPSPLANEFNVCDFPKSLKSTLENQLKTSCESVTLNQLSQVTKLTLKDLDEEQNQNLTKYSEFFPNLIELDISNNPGSKAIPEFALNLIGLKKLNISKTAITRFSEDICNLENLNTLIASHNQYEGNEVPFETFCLKNLKVLDMSESKIHYIDEYIGELSLLEELYMAGNNLFVLPWMASSLSSLMIVDFRGNSSLNKDNPSQYLNCNCKNPEYAEGEKCLPHSGETQEKEECQKNLIKTVGKAYRADAEFYYTNDVRKGESFRQMYINLASQSEELMRQCDDKESRKYCPHFITACKELPLVDKQCMLGVFESNRVKEKHRLHKDRCYAMWLGWFVDYNSPEFLNATIQARTIREMRYINIKKRPPPQKWIRSLWFGLHIPGLIDLPPRKYAPFPIEYFADHEIFSKTGLSTRIKSCTQDGLFSGECDPYFWVPDDCPHLSENLREWIEEVDKKRAEENKDQKKDNDGWFNSVIRAIFD